MIEKEWKKHYILIIDFNTFKYDHTLHCGRKKIFWYCLQAFSSEEMLKSHMKDCCKIKDKQTIVMPKNVVNLLNSKTMKEK